MFEIVADTMLLDARVTPLLHSFVVASVMESGALRELGAPSAVTQSSQTRNGDVAQRVHPSGSMAFVVLIACQYEHRSQLLPVLQTAGHFVLVAERVETGARLAAEQAPDIVVVLADSPGDEGRRALRLLKSSDETASLPTVFLTPFPGAEERIQAYEHGARDVLEYPVSARELTLRVSSIVGRPPSSPPAPTALTFKDLTLRTDTRRVYLGTDEMRLTALEFDLLATLLQSQGRVLSRRHLLSQVWQGRVGGETRTVDTHVKRLRQKIGRAAEYIETVRGIGYRLAAHSSERAPAPSSDRERGTTEARREPRGDLRVGRPFPA